MAGVRRHRLRAFVLVVSAVLLALLGWYAWRRFPTHWVLDPPPPLIVAEAKDTLSKSPPSIVEAPVTYDIDTAVDSLEAAVPRTYGLIENKLPVPDRPRASFAYTLKRSPFTVHVNGQTVSISTVVEYAGRVWYRPIIGPEVSASCGTGSAPRPRVRATLVSTGRLTPRWELRTHTRLVKLEPYSNESRDRCRLTILQIDVTGRVLDATRIMLEKHLDTFDRAVARWPVRPRFERLWSQLQRPIWLTDSVYLMIHPSAAQLGSVTTANNTVVAQLRLIASPEIVTGPRPAVPESAQAIPPLGVTDSTGHGAHVLLDASISYPVASALLRKALVGRKLEQAGRMLRICDVQLSGVGGGRMALALTVGGAARGLLYFVGTPAFDHVNHQVCVPDLDYDVGTAGMLVRSLGWLGGVDIRNYLRERARLPDSAVVGRLSVLAQRGINRTLAPGVALSGAIHGAEGTVTDATKQAIRIRATADAELKLEINRAPRIPRPKRRG